MHVVELLSHRVNHARDSRLARLCKAFEIVLFEALSLMVEAGETEEATEIGLHLNLLTVDTWEKKIRTLNESFLTLFVFKQLLYRLDMTLCSAEFFYFD